ncbi:SRPBCC family protein [Glycomyces mayteni]|uniref:SRPBCC family protein n=1 Tax=Glycomyces mayteni TaxID=543887 RepID=A0ABW2DCY9_9ACTN|nr:SRPBCC family protein [Glycomyces mayteni]
MATDEQTTDREIVLSRTVNGPRALVFKAFTEVRHLSRWWGPDGFTTTTRSFAFREGGDWDFTMHGPDGADFPNWITFTEIAAPERIRLVHGTFKDDPESFDQVLTFTDLGERTDLEMRTVFPSKAHKDLVVEQYGAIEGGKQTLGRLAAYIEKEGEI